MFYFYNGSPYTEKCGLVIDAEPLIMYIQYYRFFITWFRCGDEEYTPIESTNITCIYVTRPHSYDAKRHVMFDLTVMYSWVDETYRYISILLSASILASCDRAGRYSNDLITETDR